MIGLVCIDVDGTLVGTGGAVHPQVWPAAARLLERGVRLALCTGRPAFGTVEEFARKLDPLGWHIYQNGASVVRTEHESVSSVIPAALLDILIERARIHRRTLELYGDHAYAVESDDVRAEQHAQALGMPLERRPFSSLTESVVRAEYLLDDLELEAVLKETHPGLTLAVSSSPLMPSTHFVSFTLGGVSKASAIARVAADYGVSLEQTMIVGDSQNDLEALRVVGFPVAMGNAEPSVLEAARLRVGHVDAGGLVEALEWASNL